MLWNEYTSNERNPTWKDITIGRLWTFYFNIPYGARATLAPATGTDVSSLAPFVEWGCVGITGLGARVKSCYVTKMFKNSMCELAVEVIEPLAYS